MAHILVVPSYMDFRLKVFKQVADLLSYTKAAKALHVSQPAVSKHIHKLEDHFGKALFYREGHKISLTAEGQLLLTYANRILALYQELEHDFLALDDRFPADLTIGASTTISQYILPKALAELRRIYPQLNMTLINGNTEKIEQLLEQRKIDLGFTEGRTTHPALHYEPFRKDEIVLTTRIHNRSFKKEEVSLKELPQLPLVFREEGSGTRKVIETALGQHQLDLANLSIEMVIGSTEGIKAYLLNTDAYAFISIHAILQELKANQLKIVDVQKLEIKRDLHCVCLHGQQSQAMRLINRFLHHNQFE